MLIKNVQAVFRSLASLEKMVEKCHIQLDKQKDRLTFTLHCKHGLLKTHNLSFQDTESLQAVFDKHSCANVFRAIPRLLVETVAHFPVSVEEVTLSVSDERMLLRNHVDEELAQSKAMLTELCLASDEFDSFAVQAHISVTFCLKELRGLLYFADSIGLPISMYVNEPGSPLVLSVSDSVLEGNFVLATLSDNTRNNTRGPTSPPPPPDDFMNDDMDSYLIAMDTSVAPGPSTPESTSSKQHMVANHRSRLRGEGQEEEETADKDAPPNKKFCSLLFGSVLHLSSQMSIQPMSNQEVLASDSEDDT
ncbi:cell cycle checkpoint control protein RAD9A isoform X2 [Syngnathoides biaculeatus]|nr:cell cycle checkpoint control protein RAD9A isoform X2 [Syngnathoides biaculeatus]XP_061690022.1 cell cycle checkpoint control protein RAD9A isoform X2 [Syngnathoides biaculeatus]